VLRGSAEHMVEHIFKPADVLRPIEVLSRVERRRRWSAEAKARIVAESFEVGARVTDVARRHEISPQHLTLWRRLARTGQLVLPAEGEIDFAPVVVDRPTGSAGWSGAGVEIEVQGVVVRAHADTDLRLVAAVVRALKAAG
jgi:transposase